MPEGREPGNSYFSCFNENGDPGGGGGGPGEDAQ
eukprot:CAMPEP_0206385142 /NCGR_PEP_ID=MMETSP0294-20121207/15055_1 /ASSEMBLY_ACC=CAM_ASM_000327 /TAXON_ID=39354 /ORGANISM="Heterosigma akashiwo, Strain CCMP2393" /LENGTH=33 /DNA_ID= /DNA_START= /DNA_END= /DNA_ORIENTATION=